MLDFTTCSLSWKGRKGKKEYRDLNVPLLDWKCFIYKSSEESLTHNKDISSFAQRVKSLLNWNQVWDGPYLEMYACQSLRVMGHKRLPWEEKLSFFTLHWAHFNESKDSTELFSCSRTILVPATPLCVWNFQLSCCFLNKIWIKYPLLGVLS